MLDQECRDRNAGLAQAEQALREAALTGSKQLCFLSQGVRSVLRTRASG